LSLVNARANLLGQSHLPEVSVFRTCLVLAQIGILSGTINAQPLQSSPTLTEAEKVGRKVFQTRCAMCHVGQEPASEMATPAGERRPGTMGPLLSKANTADENRLRTKIKDGSRLMPGYKHTLTDGQIDQVIAFLKTVERPMTRIALTRAGE
jgi:mono/diheme cytochrome c family protein